MKISVIILFFILATGCGSTNHSTKSSPDSTILSSSIDQSKRNIDQFKKITHDMNVDQIYAIVGPPDRDIGSGLHIFEYSMEDASKVIIGCDGKKVFYVRHNGEDILR